MSPHVGLLPSVKVFFPLVVYKVTIVTTINIDTTIQKENSGTVGEGALLSVGCGVCCSVGDADGFGLSGFVAVGISVAAGVLVDATTSK